MARKTNAKQEIFAREWVIDRNGTRAAIAAGYSPKTASAASSGLLKNRKVAKRIEELDAKRHSKLELTAERLDEELAAIALSNMFDYIRVTPDGAGAIDLTHLTREQAAAITEISEDSTGGSNDGERKLIIRTKLKLHDKLKAIEQLNRIKGRFNDKLEVSGDTDMMAALAAGRQRIRKTDGDTGSNP